MSQDPVHGDTSDRLFTAEDLEKFARQQLEESTQQAPAKVQGDPLTDPIPGFPTAPPPSGPPPAPPQSWPQAVRTDDTIQVAAVRAAAHTAPPPHTPPPAAPYAPPPEEPRRFMTATDFLDRREGEKELGPASWGWRGRVRRWSGGVIKPRMGAKEQAHEEARHAIQKDFDGPRTIAFINPKGGAAKTTGVLAAGYTFGTIRGGGVVAWDNNETRGTLGIRGTRSSHRNTTRELLEDLGRFKDVYQSRIGDLGAFVRSQGDAHFDVLASDERPDVTGMIRAEDFKEVHQLLERFYRVILVDTGNNMRAENWLAAAEAADLLVVTSTIREDTGYSGLWMLDALQESGYADLKRKTISVISDPSAQVDAKLAHDLEQVYEQRTRAVYRVPYDPVLVSGSVVPYAQLSENTKESWLRACAGMAEAL
jgi:MinD-like ATPase involved in chromosome partitioning or flagellar assembly